VAKDVEQRAPALRVDVVGAGLDDALMRLRLLDKNWIVRAHRGRAVMLTPRGRAGLKDLLAI
jgi:hypothetical protein